MPDDKRDENNTPLDDEDWDLGQTMDSTDEMELDDTEEWGRTIDSPSRKEAPADDEETWELGRTIDSTDEWELDDTEELGRTMDSPSREREPVVRPSPMEELGPTMTSPPEGLRRPLRPGDTLKLSPRELVQEFGLLADPASRRIFRLDHPRNFIGRDRGVQVFVDDPYASGKHASIRCEKVSGSPRGEFVLRDLDSENGTYVNGQRISGDTVLEDGNVIRVGETELVFKRIERKP